MTKGEEAWAEYCRQHLPQFKAALKTYQEHKAACRNELGDLIVEQMRHNHVKHEIEVKYLALDLEDAFHFDCTMDTLIFSDDPWRR